VKSSINSIAASLAMCCAAASCSPAPSAGDGSQPAADNRIVLTGASTIAPLMSEIGKRFESLHPQVRVDVQTGGSSRGIGDARRGLADIGMVSRSLKPEEQDLHPFAVARDGVCLIVHADNPIEALSDEQVVAIYTDKINNWSEVGGRDAPITVVNKAEGRSTLELFLSHYKLESPQVQADIVIGDNEQGVKTVAGNPDAIGYVSIGTAEYDASHGVPIRLLPLDGVEASVENVGLGRFPLSRPLHLVTRTPPEGLVRELIDFAQSEQVHDLIREQYFVPIR
jgi:phosphate transport system substrate-binding protein